MRYFLLGILSAVLAALVGVIALFIVAPRVDWGAAQEPGAMENTLATTIISRWIAHGASAATTPMLPTADSLESGREEYNEHCAACHGLDGSGRDQFEADFLSRVPRLTGDAQNLTDGELYFVISRGIRNTANAQLRNSPQPRGDLEDDLMGAPSCTSDTGGA